MNSADLSVILPNYNHARYLPRSLTAIFDQSVQPREVIVLDDASTDDSVAIIEAFAKRHSTLRLVRNPANCGVVANMNRGLELASGRYLATCAADDFTLPGFFEKTIAMLERHPAAGLCFANDAFQIGDDGPLQSNPGNWPTVAAFHDADSVCRHLRHTIAGHATVYRTQSLRDAGGFDPALEWYCDWFVNLTLAFRHGACHIPEALAVRVVLDRNYSANAKPGPKHIEALKRFFDCITSPALADVGPLFRRNGAVTFFGTDVIRAAAARSDVWRSETLGLLNGFTDEQYREALEDSDETVREIAAFFLGPFWRQREQERQRHEAELAAAKNELEALRKKAPPDGAAQKLKWIAKLAMNRLRRAG